MAHLVPQCEFPLPNEEEKIDDNWTVHQLKTTANFSQKSKIFSWYIGGLNFQVEHHLFSNICHIHYKKLSHIVKKTAQEYNVPYYSNKTFAHALSRHAKMLYNLGRPKVSTQ